jgi:hypothetical protein
MVIHHNLETAKKAKEEKLPWVGAALGAPGN